MKLLRALDAPEGDGVTVKRLMPIHGMRHFDPFVLWDHFDIGADRGFPDHPHRGFEAITYVFAGGMRHADNMGNKSTVTACGAQRFTAGRGLVHSEMPADEGASGIQLWINLPRSLKQIDPDYQQVDAADLPERAIAGGATRTIAGEGSPLALRTEVEYLDIQLEAGASLARNISGGHRGLVYMVEGAAEIDGNKAVAGDACYVENTKRLAINAVENMRMMWCFGRPHHEPILQHGPFVD